MFIRNTGINIRHLLQKDDQIEELQDLILGQMKFKVSLFRALKQV